MNLVKRRLIPLAVALAGAAAISACGNPALGNRETTPAVQAQNTRVPGEYLVTVAPRVRAKAIAELYEQFGIKDIRDLGGNIFLLILAEDPGPARMEQLREENAHIRAIQPNFTYGIRRPGTVR
ncbi:MAG: hypothetical protein ABI423_03265 [Burkholderiales bacterium]